MYTFEFNDSLQYRRKSDIITELREIADRMESNCRSFPSCKFKAPAGWLHSTSYEEGMYDDDDLFDEEDD